MLANQIFQLHSNLNEHMKSLDFENCTDNITGVKNPSENHPQIYRDFLSKFHLSPAKILFVGINPSYNLCKTGIPFEDPHFLKTWMNIDYNNQDSRISDHSGSRFWGLFSEICSKEDFFRNSFIFNYCPLTFRNETGNIAPVGIKEKNNCAIIRHLEDKCNEFYKQMVDLLKPDVIVAIGKYVQEKSANLFGTQRIVYMPHPSPLFYENSIEWTNRAKEVLHENDLMKYFQNEIAN